MSYEPGTSVHSLRTKPRRRGERQAMLWTMVSRLLSMLVVLGLLAALGLWIYPELVRHADLAAQLEKKTAELAAEQALRKKREREKFLLENDPDYVETIARDKLELMKEGETIFRIESSPASQPDRPGS
ncbi:MAG: septum formation initiator family protein [Terrimicrobiaceae bacterium]|nr:septum formation initiator family protein [Terrimicrobiaceae bacterium]